MPNEEVLFSKENNIVYRQATEWERVKTANNERYIGSQPKQTFLKSVTSTYMEKCSPS